MNTVNFGPYSEPVEYWTAPEKLGSGSVSYNKTSYLVKWNQVKSVDGYIVRGMWHWQSGYNVFLQEVYGHHEECKATKNTSITAWKFNEQYPLDIEGVYPYSIHNGFIFVNGAELTNSLNTMLKSMIKE